MKVDYDFKAVCCCIMPLFFIHSQAGNRPLACIFSIVTFMNKANTFKALHIVIIHTTVSLGGSNQRSIVFDKKIAIVQLKGKNIS